MSTTTFALGLFIALTTLVYSHVGFANIMASYRMWFREGYWVNYNVVEAIAWIAKAAVIIPGLVWQKGDLAATYHHTHYFGAVDLGLGA